MQRTQSVLSALLIVATFALLSCSKSDDKPDPLIGQWTSDTAMLEIEKHGSQYLVSAVNPGGGLNGTFSGDRVGNRIALGAPHGDVSYLSDGDRVLWAGVSFRRFSIETSTTPSAGVAGGGGGGGSRTEAEVYLDAIKKGLKGRLADFAGFVNATEPMTPRRPCCESGRKDRKCDPDASIWTSGDPAAPSGWDEIGFNVDDPHYFQYSYTGTFESFTALAVGDLDCDGTSVTYSLTGEYNSGNPKYEFMKPARAD